MFKLKILSHGDFWIEFLGNDGSQKLEHGKMKDMWTYYIACRFDGCIDYRHWNNGYEYGHDCNDECQCSEDYIHICDIDEFIEQLQEIKKNRHF